MTAFFFLVLLGVATPNKLPLAEQFYIGGIDTVNRLSLAIGLAIMDILVI